MGMRLSYDQLYATAVARKGADVLEERLPTCKTSDELAALADDRVLSRMAKGVFAAGFVWRVVEAKWPGFEEAFQGFDPLKVAAIAEARPGELATDTRIIRNPQKINATYENARFVLDIAEEHGSFGRFVAGWPDDDIVGLWALLKKRGARLGGDTGPRFLRGIGKDTFILTPDVVQSLTDQGILQGKGTSKKAQKAAQEAFCSWKEESGRPFCEISMVIACTTGADR